MTIEIIKGGIAPSVRKWLVTCPDCGTVYTYQKDDLSHCQRGEGSCTYCPVCKRGVQHRLGKEVPQ